MQWRKTATNEILFLFNALIITLVCSAGCILWASQSIGFHTFLLYLILVPGILISATCLIYVPFVSTHSISKFSPYSNRLHETLSLDESSLAYGYLDSSLGCVVSYFIWLEDIKECHISRTEVTIYGKASFKRNKSVEQEIPCDSCSVIQWGNESFSFSFLLNFKENRDIIKFLKEHTNVIEV